MFDMKYDKDGQPLKNDEMEALKNEDTAEEKESLEANDSKPVENDEANNASDNLLQAQGEDTKESKPSPEPKEDDIKVNMRNLREAKERAERERDELVNYFNSMKEKPAAEDDDNIDFKIDPDDFAEGKHLEKVTKRIKRQEKQLNEMIIENKLKSQFPDFDSVVTEANLKHLSKEDPELVDTLQLSTDLYKKAVVAYKNIKRHGIYKDKDFSSEKDVVKNNSAKPRSANSASAQTGAGPLSQANAFADGLTPDLKEKLYKEMIESMKKR